MVTAECRVLATTEMRTRFSVKDMVEPVNTISFVSTWHVWAGRKKKVLYILVDTSQSPTGHLTSCHMHEIRLFDHRPRLMRVDAHSIRVVLCCLTMHSSSK